MTLAELKTQIIPKAPIELPIEAEHALDLKAICVFTAVGFFLDQDTYWKDRKVLRPATSNKITSDGFLENSTQDFKWVYQPREISFTQALEEFSHLFESIVEEQTQNRKVILPLSGGLDSRTQAVALKHKREQVYAYSYKFERGFDEVSIAEQLAILADFKFDKFTIPEGYLWKQLDELVVLNNCASEFTSPRQMAVIENLKDKGELFSLGHWGDVLFDDMKVEDTLDFEGRLQVVLKKIVKPGGMDLAQELWGIWGLEGTFKAYFYERVKSQLRAIDIPQSANAHIRAFKSMYWAPRWTSVNLAVFESIHPISLPYYDDRMCRFICTIPEQYLKNRQLQIAYIKTRAPEMAKITWQDHRPYNLFNYSKNKSPYNIPYKVQAKVKRTLNKMRGKSYVMRNWELQFLGNQNRANLEKEIFNEELVNWTSREMLEKAVNTFYESPAPKTAHPLNMLLVLSKFIQQKRE